MKDLLNCLKCGHTWIPVKDNPKKCPVCGGNWRGEYKKKYIKNPNGRATVLVTDKCYFMLVRKKTHKDEIMHNVIRRIVNDNNYSETVRYTEEPRARQIELPPELKMQLFDIANEKNIKSVNEVIWRLL